MLRRNRLHSTLSQPQLVWGDAVYFLGQEALFARLEALAPRARGATLTRFILLLLCHRIHDYALEVAEVAKARQLITKEIADSLAESVRRSAHRRAGFLVKCLAGALLAAATFAVSSPFPRPRRLARLYWRRRAGYLFHYLWRGTALEGVLEGSISDAQF
jgi:hypothetical protein